MSVICNKKDDEFCPGCGYEIPHEPMDYDGLGELCTKKSECWDGNIVRFKCKCIKIKED
jgi:hypothetical protein